MTLDDTLRVQEEIAAAIAGALRTQAAPRPHEADVEAHNLYPKGRYFWNQRTEEGFTGALELFEFAVRRDPALARAYAGIADTHILMMMHGVAAAHRHASSQDRRAEGARDRSPVRRPLEAFADPAP